MEETLTTDLRIKPAINRYDGVIIGVGRFRILGGGGGQGLEYWWGEGDQIPSRHMTSY